jgi:hypothetical protein
MPSEQREREREGGRRENEQSGGGGQLVDKKFSLTILEHHCFDFLYQYIRFASIQLNTYKHLSVPLTILLSYVIR